MPAEYLVWVGLRPPSFLHLLSASLLPLLLTALLYTGPLVTTLIDYVDHGRTLESEQMTATSDAARQLQKLIHIRSLLVGPIAEEWVFRACMCPLLFAAGLPDGANVAVASVIFGAAHLHHRFDARERWAAVLVQFTYTSLFGAYSAYLFLRTGLVYGPIAAHVFCNYMGLPSFYDMVEHRRRHVVTGAYIIGIVGFVLSVAVDTSFRPAIFASIFWPEQAGCGVDAI
uniref:intramembrane prenyl-peptidase Rce1 n=1 Tax=Chrysotila carterae TaxID=13221 RepID=A0A7S4C4T9_CHRCT